MQYTDLPLLEMAMNIVSQIEIELEMNELSHESLDVNAKRKKKVSRKTLELAKNLVSQIELELNPTTFESNERNETKVNDGDDDSIDLLQENDSDSDSIESLPEMNSLTNFVSFPRESSQDTTIHKFSQSDSSFFATHSERGTRSTCGTTSNARSTCSTRSMSSNSSFRSLVSQLTERKSASRHSEIEKASCARCKLSEKNKPRRGSTLRYRNRIRLSPFVHSDSDGRLREKNWV